MSYIRMLLGNETPLKQTTFMLDMKVGMFSNLTYSKFLTHSGILEHYERYESFRYAPSHSHMQYTQTHTFLF
jgi:hypothetical protein